MITEEVIRSYNQALKEVNLNNVFYNLNKEYVVVNKICEIMNINKSQKNRKEILSILLTKRKD
jgi:hypothetical protein